MHEANALVMRRALVLWIGTGLLLAFDIFAATYGGWNLAMWAIALSGGFALFGVAFGIWAARTISTRT